MAHPHPLGVFWGGKRKKGRDVRVFLSSLLGPRYGRLVYWLFQSYIFGTWVAASAFISAAQQELGF